MPKVSPAHMDARRTHILQAATRCIARKGLGETTMSDIFQEAGLSAGAVYHYFSSKQEILQGVLAHFVSETRAATLGLVGGEHAPAGLRQVLMGGLMLLEHATPDSDARLPLMVHGEALRDPDVASSIRGLYRTTVEAFRSAVIGLQSSGHIDPDLDAEYLCWMALCAFEGWRIMKLTNPHLSTNRFSEMYQRVFAPLFEDPEPNSER